MTDKHIWENGETITADLLNGMSSYVDDMVSTIPKIDPDTLVKTTALASDVNLLAGTSDEWQSVSTAPDSSGWITKEHDDITLMDVTDLSYSIEIQSAPVDLRAIIVAFKDGRTDGVQLFGNVIKAGESGMSTLSTKLPDGYKIIHVVVQSAATTTDTAPVKLTYRREKLNVGPYATPYCDQAVTDVGGQKPTNGHIDMGAYALLADVVVKNGGLPAMAQRLDSTYDLDTILDAGIYYVQVAKNQPKPGNGTLLVIGNNLKDSDRRATQLYFTDTLTGSYTYHRNVGYTHQTDAEAMKEWSPWVVDATSADINALNSRINDLQNAITKLQGGATE